MSWFAEKHVSVYAVVGGSVGGAMLLVLVIVAIVLKRRNTRLCEIKKMSGFGDPTLPVFFVPTQFFSLCIKPLHLAAMLRCACCLQYTKSLVVHTLLTFFGGECHRNNTYFWPYDFISFND